MLTSNVPQSCHCQYGSLQVRRNSAKVLLLVEMLAEGYPDLPCFAHAPPGAVCAGRTLSQALSV
jgi:hypothetical protein